MKRRGIQVRMTCIDAEAVVRLLVDPSTPGLGTLDGMWRINLADRLLRAIAVTNEREDKE